MSSEFGYGQFTPWDTTHELNVICAIVRTMLARVDTMKLVKVIAVHPGQGNPPAAGTVDVLPLVNQVDGLGNATKQGTVFGIPWWRLQGGTGAVICDPAVNDIGYVICADRDSSNVVRTKAQANPGSFRSFNIADGIYVGGVLNAAPTQFVSFTQQGMAWQDANGNSIVSTASGINITPKNGQPATVTGPLVVTQTLTVDTNAQVQGNLEVDGTSDLKGNVHAEGTMTVDGALAALSVKVGTGATISRVIVSGTLAVSGSVPAGGTSTSNFGVTGVKAGDYCVVANPNAGGGANIFELYATCPADNVVAITVGNSNQTTAVGYSYSTKVLVFGAA